MTTERFSFQRDCAARALDQLQGPVLNVGCNEDPALLKGLDPDRVVNCDLFAHDSVLDRPNRADVLFDCARDRWPFSDREAALVILGDILEHLKPGEIDSTLREARRVGQRLCVTVPEDHRDTNSDEQADRYPRGAVHRTIVTETLLRGKLTDAGWEPVRFERVDYFFCPVGWFVEAR